MRILILLTVVVAVAMFTGFIISSYITEEKNIPPKIITTHDKAILVQLVKIADALESLDNKIKVFEEDKPLGDRNPKKSMKDLTKEEE